MSGQFSLSEAERLRINWEIPPRWHIGEDGTVTFDGDQRYRRASDDGVFYDEDE